MTLLVAPCRGVPLAFFGLRGKDEQVEHSNSWCNRYEAQKIVELVRDLIAHYSDVVGSKGEHIAVVSGFQLQTKHIRQRLKSAIGGCKVMVAPVETIQGQEMQV